MPMIGKTEDGVWYATGFGGHGNVNIICVLFCCKFYYSCVLTYLICRQRLGSKLSVGIVPTTLAGELVASGIAQGDERWKMFATPFPLRYAGLACLLMSLFIEFFYHRVLIKATTRRK